MATDKASMLEEQKNGESYWQFGSNRYADLNEDGTVFYNTHDLEYMDFDNLSDFADWFFDGSTTVTFDYQCVVGHRDDDGTITFDEPYDGEIDEEECGDRVWSAIERVSGANRPA